MIIAEIHHGNMDAVMEVIQAIPEFENIPSRTTILERITGVPHLILTAHDGKKTIGFKIGYQRENKFYSWMGAVLPEYRRLEIAGRLADEQEKWVKDHGYHFIWMKTRNCFPAMLIMAVRRGFKIKSVDIREDIVQNRIVLEKKLE